MALNFKEQREWERQQSADNKSQTQLRKQLEKDLGGTRNQQIIAANKARSDTRIGRLNESGRSGGGGGSMNSLDQYAGSLRGSFWNSNPASSFNNLSRMEAAASADTHQQARENLELEQMLMKQAVAKGSRKPQSGVSSMKSNISSDMDAFEQKLRDKKMFEAQLAQQQQQTQSMKVADELARLKLQQEEQKRAEIRSMLMNLMGANGNAGTSGVAANSWQEQLVDIGGQKFPMRVNSSESMLPQLLQSLSALAQ